jgi:OOP family OmpA-OmpF porin
MAKKSTKIILIVGGVILLGVGAYLLLKRRKKPTPIVENTDNVLKDVFDNLNFEFGKAEIKKESLPYLDSLADTIIKAKNWKLDIEGHTDDKGGNEVNMKLSQSRADAVKNYLVSKGVSAEIITAKGFGENKPLVPNDSDANREKNRRVEFKITKPNNEVITTIAQ